MQHTSKTFTRDAAIAILIIGVQTIISMLYYMTVDSSMTKATKDNIEKLFNDFYEAYYK